LRVTKPEIIVNSVQDLSFLIALEVNDTCKFDGRSVQKGNEFNIKKNTPIKAEPKGEFMFIF
jgi:hypothetical protein